MKIISVYVDTSVIGGCCDIEFQEWSKGLLIDFKSGNYKLMLSELTSAEIQDAPAEVQSIYKEFIDCTDKIIELDIDAVELADAYLNHKILSPNFRDDARHIAMATIAGADVIVSWNFKHIVHFNKIQMFNAVNIEMGYKPIMIFSPREVTTYVYQND